MTLTTALARLAAAGRIRSAWLPGMLGIRPRHDPPETMRVLTVATPGPRVWSTDDCSYLCTDREDGWPDDAEPDLTDPATSGCLLAVLREASGDPLTIPFAERTGDEFSTGVRWVVGLPNGHVVAPTEGEAIAAALVALAEALP